MDKEKLQMFVCVDETLDVKSNSPSRLFFENQGEKEVVGVVIGRSGQRPNDWLVRFQSCGYRVDRTQNLEF